MLDCAATDSTTAMGSPQPVNSLTVQVHRYAVVAAPSQAHRPAGALSFGGAMSETVKVGAGYYGEFPCALGRGAVPTCTGTLKLGGEEYGGLAGGGDYEYYLCDNCGRRKWMELPD